MYLVLVMVAALAYTLGGMYMKLSKGLSKLVPSLLVYFFLIAGASMEAIAMEGSSLGVTYLFVIGVEFILAFLGAAFLFRESYSHGSLFGVSLIVAGIIMLSAGEC
jgi:multidrug transporter EmrE-like cation transporter